MNPKQYTSGERRIKELYDSVWARELIAMGKMGEYTELVKRTGELSKSNGAEPPPAAAIRTLEETAKGISKAGYSDGVEVLFFDTMNDDEFNTALENAEDLMDVATEDVEFNPYYAVAVQIVAGDTNAYALNRWESSEDGSEVFKPYKLEDLDSSPDDDESDSADSDFTDSSSSEDSESGDSFSSADGESDSADSESSEGKRPDPPSKVTGKRMRETKDSQNKDSKRTRDG